MLNPEGRCGDLARLSKDSEATFGFSDVLANATGVEAL